MRDQFTSPLSWRKNNPSQVSFQNGNSLITDKPQNEQKDQYTFKGVARRALRVRTTPLPSPHLFTLLL